MIDGAGIVGQDSAITLGSDGQAVISYFDATNGVLKVAHCVNAACTLPADIVGIPLTGGQQTSITIGADGLPVVSHYDAPNGDLKLLHCDRLNCFEFSFRTVLDSVGNVGQYTSVTVGTDGLPVISYYDVTNGDLKVAHCSNRFCLPNHRPR